MKVTDTKYAEVESFVKIDKKSNEPILIQDNIFKIYPEGCWYSREISKV